MKMAIGLTALVLAVGVGLLSTVASADVEKTYKSKCAVCHAADGSGDTPAGKKTGARDFASPEAKAMSDEEMAAITAKGKGKMPGYAKSLKEEQIKELVSYIRELVKKR